MSSEDQLWYAADRGDAVEVSRLLAEGADPNHIPVLEEGNEGYVNNGGNFVFTRRHNVDQPQNTALINAALNDYVDVVRVLLDAPDIDIYATGDYDSTALHFAAANGNEEIVKLLLAKYDKNKLTIEDVVGRVALDVAIENGHGNIVSLIQQKQFEIKLPVVVPINVGDRIKVPILNTDDMYDCTVVEVGLCRWEITESKLMEFYRRLQNINKADSSDPQLKEALQFLYPSTYPTNEPVTALSPGNVFQDKGALLELLRTLNSEDMDTATRRARLAEISTFPIYAVRMLKLVYRAYDVIKPSQVIRVKFDNNHDVFGYYVAHDCSASNIHFIAEDYMETNDDDSFRHDGIIPALLPDNTILSILPVRYPHLEQITEINSWITHGMLSLYLIRPDIVQSVCTHPLVGNEEFWRYVQDMMERQFAILHSLTLPADGDIEVYRGSPYFNPRAVRTRSIFATAKIPEIANTFSPNRSSKVIIVPSGTRILDLSDINKLEQEILIFPTAREANMVIEPVNLKNPLKRRNTYRIRNSNANRNRNIPRSRRRKSRRSSRQRQTRRRR